MAQGDGTEVLLFVAPDVEVAATDADRADLDQEVGRADGGFGDLAPFYLGTLMSGGKAASPTGLRPDIPAYGMLVPRIPSAGCDPPMILTISGT